MPPNWIFMTTLNISYFTSHSSSFDSWNVCWALNLVHFFPSFCPLCSHMCIHSSHVEWMYVCVWGVCLNIHNFIRRFAAIAKRTPGKTRQYQRAPAAHSRFPRRHPRFGRQLRRSLSKHYTSRHTHARARSLTTPVLVQTMYSSIKYHPSDIPSYSSVILSRKNTKNTKYQYTFISTH